MKNGKGRIDPWQPKRKQRRKAAKSINQGQQGTTKGTRRASPKFFWAKRGRRDGQRVCARLLELNLNRNRFLSRGTQISIGAKGAVEAGFRAKLPFCNSLCLFFHA